MGTISISAQNIDLPAPNLAQQSLSTMETLAKRHSVREYSNKELTIQELSNLCWAACGQSRDAEHITAPSALNHQEVRLYVFDKNAVYEYLAKENMLKKVADGDHRNMIAGPQDFVLDAPVSLLMVLDFEKFGMSGEHATIMGCVDVGNISENINLYCESVGLATVPRITMDNNAISKLLGFDKNQMPVLNNPVGWPK